MREFQPLLQSFLIDYLPRRRGLSTHTISSYRDTFVLLLKWLDSAEGITPDKVTMAALDPERISRFSVWLREERGCSATTSNARIAAIRSFAKFVQAEAPEHIELCRRILEIPSVAAPKTMEVEFLSVRAVQQVVAAGSDDIRALAIVSLLYDSGARVSEMCGMTIGDLTFSRPHTVKVLGKGRKTRVIPLSSQVGGILSRYIGSVRSHAGPTDPLFVNRSGNTLGRAGVAYLLQKMSPRHTSPIPRTSRPRRTRTSCAIPKPCTCSRPA